MLASKGIFCGSLIWITTHFTSVILKDYIRAMTLPQQIRTTSDMALRIINSFIEEERTLVCARQSERSFEVRFEATGLMTGSDFDELCASATDRDMCGCAQNSVLQKCDCCRFKVSQHWTIRNHKVISFA